MFDIHSHILPGIDYGARDLSVGPEPLQLATTLAGLDGLGLAGSPRRMRAPAALVRAALAQDAGVTVAEEGEVSLTDGVGALLRWSDDSTPGGTLLSQSADKGRLRALS